MSQPRKREPLIQVKGNYYLRIPIKTHVLTGDDDIFQVICKYIAPVKDQGDLLFVSEKATAITQGRAYLLSDIKPRPLARFLSKFVKKVSYGIGLGIPETMEMAFREVGTLRILLAAFVAVIGKLFGRSGDFYRIAGRKVAMIDGPTPYTLPPYNGYVVLAPDKPQEIVDQVEKELGLSCAIVDINDLGSEVVALSPKAGFSRQQIAAILKDNPLGQGSQQTPMGLIKALSEEEAKSFTEVAGTVQDH
ncbi:MAG: F420-0--gamma-glutamyl ligase [Bacillota bacterium]